MRLAGLLTRQGLETDELARHSVARCIVGWRVSSSMRTDFLLYALEQALYERQPQLSDQLINHSDRGAQYVSIRYTERLAEAGIEPSVGSRGDSYDNALAETITGCTRPSLATAVHPGNQGSPLNWPPCKGRTCTTTSDCSNPSGTSRRPKLRQTAGGNSPNRPRLPAQLKLTSLTHRGAPLFCG